MIKDYNDINEYGNYMYNKGIEDFSKLIKESLEHDWNTTKISEQIIYNRIFDKCEKIEKHLTQ